MITETELAGYRAVQTAIRTEVARLACAAGAPRDPAHEDLLEGQLGLVLDALHSYRSHHEEEIWPYLLEQDPRAADPLAALAAGHAALAALQEAAGDPRTPLRERSSTLWGLHQLLDELVHLTEHVVVPLLLDHYTPALLARDQHKALAEIGRRRMALVFGWVASCHADDHLDAALAEHPQLVQFLFRRFWWPRYQERMTELYGPQVHPVSASLAEGTAA